MDRFEAAGWGEEILFFAIPDLLLALCLLAFYDNDSDDTAGLRFTSGCCSIVTFVVRENRRQGRSCFIGMFDLSVRLLIQADELLFVIPVHHFRKMVQTMTTQLFSARYTPP